MDKISFSSCCCTLCAHATGPNAVKSDSIWLLKCICSLLGIMAPASRLDWRGPCGSQKRSPQRQEEGRVRVSPQVSISYHNPTLAGRCPFYTARFWPQWLDTELLYTERKSCCWLKRYELVQHWWLLQQKGFWLHEDPIKPARASLKA